MNFRMFKYLIFERSRKWLKSGDGLKFVDVCEEFLYEYVQLGRLPKYNA